MIVNVYNKEVEVRDKAVQIYEEFFHEPFTDIIARYMAHSIECYESMNPSAEEIARAIEQNIAEHISIYRGAVGAIAALKKENENAEESQAWGFGYTES